MNHKQAEFTFYTNQGVAVKVQTKPFCFELEDKFIEMVSADVYKQYQKNQTIDFEITLDKVKQYYPQLLGPVKKRQKLSSIDWAKQDFDKLMDVTAFFFEYRANASVRRLKSEQDKLASNLEAMRKILALNPSIGSTNEQQ